KISIAGKQCDADTGPPDNGAATQWRYGYPCNDLLNALCNPVDDRRITGPSVIDGNLSKIDEGSLRIFDPHAFRNKAKAASTSFSLAASPLSPASIAANSSGAASYSALVSSASISSAISASSCCRPSGQVGTRSNTALT